MMGPKLPTDSSSETLGAGNGKSCKSLLLHNCTSDTPLSTPKDDTHALEPKAEGEWCSARQDSLHCTCWYDGKACCGCKAPALTSEEMLALGIAEE